MRILTTLPCLVFAVIFARGAAAVEIDAPRLFASLDANADGRVTLAESGDENARLFARLVRTSDDDGDGQLTADEFAAGLTPVRVEKNLVEKEGSRLPGSDALIVMVARMDANGNRRIEADEVPAALRGMFQQMLKPADADKNGSLETRELADTGLRLGLIAQMTAARLGIDVAGELAKLPPERRSALERMSAYPNPQEMMADPAQAAELFARFDANGDGFLIAGEAPEGLVKLIKRADKNRDGKLSAAEFQTASQRAAAMNAPPADPAAVRRNVRQLLKRFDRDGDGKLSREEVPPRMAGNFDRLDQDASQSLDEAELQRSGAGRGAMRGFGGGAPPTMDQEMQ